MRWTLAISAYKASSSTTRAARQVSMVANAAGLAASVESGDQMATITYTATNYSDTVVLSDGYTVNDQGSPSIALLEDGTLVTTFDHFGTTQLALTAYDPGAYLDTDAPGYELAPVNTTFTGDQYGSQTAALGEGFVTVFNDTSSGVNQVRFRIFDENGNAAANDAPIFQSPSAYKLGGVATLSNGDFVIAVQVDPTASDQNVNFALYSPTGASKGVYAVDNSATADTVSPAIAATDNINNSDLGGFAIAWSVVAGDGSTDIYVQRYGATPITLGSKILVDSAGTNNDQVQIIGLEDGGFAIAYRNDEEIGLRFYNENGTPRTSAFVANQIVDGIQEKPSLALLANGFVALSWQTASSADPTNTDIAARIFDPNGVAVTDQYVIADGAGAESNADMVGLLGGKLAHVYETNDPGFDGNGTGVAIVQTIIERTITGDATDETLTGDELIDDIHGGGGDDIIYAGDEGDRVEGGAGADIMDGGEGYNLLIYRTSPTGVVVDLAAGTGKFGDAEGDVIAVGSFYYVSGSDSGDTLYGDDGFNSLSGFTGNDRLYGRGGIDYLSGGDGDDILNGGAGADSMRGHDGSDKYYVDDAGDSLIETVGFGAADRVYTSISYQLAAGEEIEILNTTSNGGVGAINLVGNEFAQTIVGNAGKNIISGLGGADTLRGLGGDDIYGVDNSAEVVIEEIGGGADRVYTSVSFSLKSGVEVETLTTNDANATTALKLAGNAFANAIAGNAGDNFINGAGGADTLTGLAGKDTFMFNTALGVDNIDEVTDFSVADDTIRLDSAIFANIAGTGVLTAAQFIANASGTAQDGNDRIVYETDTGKLFYDENGSAAGGAVQFALLDAGLAITNADFFIV
jgi:Ca2+-binding RTX toxin-like protein